MKYEVMSSSQDEEAWHADRAKVITASEMAELANSGASAWVRIKAEKAGLAPRWKGSPATQWGHEREPHIMESLRERHGIEPNTHLLVSVDNPLHGGTPDGIHKTKPIIGEAKAHNGARLTEPTRKWETQADWNMHVTGAEKCVLAVEYYDEHAPGEFRTRDFSRPQEFVIERNDDRIERLIGIAGRFFDLGEPTQNDLLLARAVEAKQNIKAAQAEWAAVEAEILATIDTRERFNHVHPELGSFSFTPPTQRESFDAKKLQESDPDTYEKYVIPGRVPKPTVRVNIPKEK